MQNLNQIGPLEVCQMMYQSLLKKERRKNNFSAKNGQFQSSIISKLFGISTRSKRHFVPLVMIYLYTKFQNCAAIREARKKTLKMTFLRLEAACNIVQLRYAVFLSLGRRPLSRSHDNFSRNEWMKKPRIPLDS